MSKKKKKKGKYTTLEKIVLATALINLIESLVDLLKKFLT